MYVNYPKIFAVHSEKVIESSILFFGREKTNRIFNFMKQKRKTEVNSNIYSFNWLYVPTMSRPRLASLSKWLSVRLRTNWL